MTSGLDKPKTVIAEFLLCRIRPAYAAFWTGEQAIVGVRPITPVEVLEELRARAEAPQRDSGRAGNSVVYRQDPLSHHRIS